MTKARAQSSHSPTVPVMTIERGDGARVVAPRR